MMRSWFHRACFLFAALPARALTVGFGARGEPLFVLYREPKLAALGFCAAVLLWLAPWLGTVHLGAVHLGTGRFGAVRFGALVEQAQRPVMLALAAFLSWAAMSIAWVEVVPNHLYEMAQYLVLYIVLLTLLVAGRSDLKVAVAVRWGLISSLAVATVIGWLQLAGVMPFLVPIDPQVGVRHPSVMGYKNPMALALLGQIFVLCGVAATALRGDSKRRWLGLICLLLVGLELTYLVSLQSRTALFAAAVAGVVLGLMMGTRGLRWVAARRWIWVGSAAGLALIAITLAALPQARQRALGMGEYLASPSTYLDSDRGIYLRNTMQMVSYRPLGVGLGDWQTAYAVSRRVERHFAFSAQQQVRRAHSDHVQFLGEMGVVGGLLWLIFLGTVLRRSWRQARDPSGCLLFAQLVAVILAMATDYVLDLPYQKLQWFLLLFLLLNRQDETRAAAAVALAEVAPPEVAPPEVAPSGVMLPGRWAWLMTVAYAGLGVVLIAASINVLRIAHLSAAIRGAHQQATSRPGQPELALAEGRRIVDYGRRLSRVAGHSKELHRDFLLVGHAAYWIGDERRAIAATAKALELHPYYPNAMDFMSRLAPNKRTAAEWQRAYGHVLYEAERGFEVPYPTWPWQPLASKQRIKRKAQEGKSPD